MAKSKQKRTAEVEAPTKAEIAKKYARMYRVVEGKKVKPVQLVDCRVANAGQKFRAIDVLCFPDQLETLLAEKPCRIEAVKND